MAKLQDQRHGELGHGGGAVGGDVGYRDAPPGAGVAVHDVIARGLNADEPDAGTGGENRFGDWNLVHQHDLAVTDAFDGFRFRFGALVEGYLAELADAVIGEVAGVQGPAVQNNDFHGIASFRW